MSGDSRSAGSAPYARTTSIGFLDRCSPLVASFYHYWDGKRRGRPMPARGDIDPLEMRPWLGSIILVDVFENPRRLVYRLVGTRSVELRQADMTGRSVEDGFFGESLAPVLENYRLVIEERTLVYDWSAIPSANGLLRRTEALLLPLSSDGARVDMVIVYAETARA